MTHADGSGIHHALRPRVIPIPTAVQASNESRGAVALEVTASGHEASGQQEPRVKSDSLNNWPLYVGPV